MAVFDGRSDVQRDRIFTSVDPTGRVRRATDLTRLVLSGIVLVILGAAAVPHSGFEGSLVRFATSLPATLDGAWRLVADGLAILAVTLVVAAAVTRRIPVLVDIAVAVAVAIAATSLVGRLVLGEWPAAADFFRLAGRASEFPAARLAVTATIVDTTAPYLVRPLRRACRWMVGSAALSLVLVGAASATASIAALVVAVLGAAGARLALGSIHARPSLGDVAAALDALGIVAHSLEAAPEQSPGRFVVLAEGADSAPLVIKVYGRDADDTQAIAMLWRRLWYRGPVERRSIGRLQQVEHEAFLTFLASDAGVHTHKVLAGTETRNGDAVLVLTSPGEPLAADRSRWSGQVASGVWRSVATLHGRGITHGGIDDRNLVVIAEGADDAATSRAARIGIVDFHGASVSSSPELTARDHAQVLVTTALALGIDRSIGLALDHLGSQRLSEVLPVVQPGTLSGHLRAAVDAADFDLDELREQAAALTGGEAPELLKLRRVTTRSLVQFALLVVAFGALFSAFGGVDFSLLIGQVRSGIWWMILLGFLVAQLARIPAALSTAGASPQPLPLGPLYALQLALGYIGLAVPGSAARFAVNVRFLQRQGLAPGTSVAVSFLDSVFWFAVQIVVVVGILLATPLSLDLDVSGSAPAALTRLIAILGILVVVAAAVLVALPRWRRPAVDRLRKMIGEARQAADGLSSPRRLSMLIGGNLALQVLLALALATFTRSLGFRVGLIEVLLINVSVSLLAGLLPIPGGIGLVEGGLTFGLVRAGLPEEAAFATALIYRMATFYLPPLWGFFGLRWLERRQHL